MPKKDYKWTPIALWEGYWLSDGLADVFHAFREHASEAVYREYLGKVSREWSIETGQIEGAYDIPRGATLTMVEGGLLENLIPEQPNGLSPAEVYNILLDTQEALDGVFAFIKSERELSVGYIRELHQTLLKSVETYDGWFPDPISRQPIKTKMPLEKGKFKTSPNNPRRNDGSTHEYCPPEHVDAEMDQLVRLFQIMTAKEVPDVQAAWLHHAFSQIHPFADGNGRVARVLATLVLVKAGLAPFTVTRDMRTRYITALEAADAGDSRTLLDFFDSSLYRQAVRLWHVLKVNHSESLKDGASLDEILNLAKMKLIVKNDLLPTEWNRANDLLGGYRLRTRTLVEAFAAKVEAVIRAVSSNFGVAAAQTIFPVGSLSVAWAEDWGAGFSEAEVEAELVKIVTSSQGHIVVGFDTFSRTRKGLCGVFVAFKQGEKAERIGTTFFVNFKSPSRAEEFDDWLNENLALALAKWQERIG